MIEFPLLKRELIDKGWSGDKKYCATDENGKKYFLRISSLEQYEKKLSEYMMMQKVARLGVPMCQPLYFDTCKEGAYTLLSWIEGVDALEILSNCTEKESYVYGLEAGRILKKIHSIPAPKEIGSAGYLEEWEPRFNRKIDRNIKRYRECPIKHEGGELFIRYLNENRHLLKNRPLSYQHGDYHIGNMMIDKGGRLQIIDFDRNDYGDPWEDFNRIVWCAQKAPLFATGMIDGYFEGDVPLVFWKLLALYIASNMLSAIPWAIPFGRSEVDTMLDQAGDVLTWYDNMRNAVPTWYRKDLYQQRA